MQRDAPDVVGNEDKDIPAPANYWSGLWSFGRGPEMTPAETKFDAS